jgi:hypothetical protein
MRKFLEKYFRHFSERPRKESMPLGARSRWARAYYGVIKNPPIGGSSIKDREVSGIFNCPVVLSRMESDPGSFVFPNQESDDSLF